jgi:hypothetical protein
MLINLRQMRGVSMGGMGDFAGVAPAVEAARHYILAGGVKGTCPPGLYYNYTRKACLQLVNGQVPPEGKALAVSPHCPGNQMIDPATGNCRQVSATVLADAKTAVVTVSAGNSLALSNTATKIAAADPTNAAKAANAAAAAAKAAEAARVAIVAGNAANMVKGQQAGQQVAAVVALATGAPPAAPLPPVPPPMPSATPAAVLPPAALIATTTPTMIIGGPGDYQAYNPGAPQFTSSGGGGGGGGGADWGPLDAPEAAAPAAPPPGLFGLSNTQLAIGAAALVVVGYLAFHRGGGGVGAHSKG